MTEALLAIALTMLFAFAYEIYFYNEDRSRYTRELEKAANRELARQQMMTVSETFQKRGNKIAVSNAAYEIGVLQAEQFDAVKSLNAIVERLNTRMSRMTSYVVVLVLTGLLLAFA